MESDFKKTRRVIGFVMEKTDKEVIEQIYREVPRVGDFDSKLEKLCVYANISTGRGMWLLGEIRMLRQPMHVIAYAKKLGLIWIM